MIFFYNGKKPSKGYDIASGCFLIIGLGAIIFLFTSIDSFDELEGRYFELFFILLMAASTIYGIFKKKGKLHTHKIEFKNDYLYINNLKISIENIHLNIYKNGTNFCRYHIWDSNGIISIYSVFEDDLITYFIEKHSDKIIELEEISSSGNGPSYHLKTTTGSLKYDLETGEYSIIKDDEIIINKIPQIFVFDPKYKQDKPLIKKE